MLDYQSILAKYPNGVLATVENTKAKTRVFQYLFGDGNKVYFCTSSEKAVYRQLQDNPCCSFCTYAPDFSPVLSVNGKAVFVDDMELKARALDENPGIKSIYGSAQNPAFRIFYIDAEEIETFSFADGPQTFQI
ncbi:pyridoxamine 5'-phosphate oxidase family protein [Candidatus Soleaferrea massiliensis]|uniref:pyridoxamine 5'-phosphate oxidase family protein n=1 Tax=Candidatus Soleaferrea massiliensis TaxID=1470354 RepID=UPI0005903FB8|nr:pyridoxamine 5'-phosphate oxidase family protein [Candidatus Soleaferrea massiliensis]